MSSDLARRPSPCSQPPLRRRTRPPPPAALPVPRARPLTFPDPLHKRGSLGQTPKPQDAELRTLSLQSCGTRTSSRPRLSWGHRPGFREPVPIPEVAVCGRPGGHVGGPSFLAPPPCGLAERQPLAEVSLGPSFSAVRGRRARDGAAGPWVPGRGEAGRPRRKWWGKQLLGARREGDSGLHFPGGRARGRKCPEPLSRRSGLADLLGPRCPVRAVLGAGLSRFTRDPRERPPGGRGGSRRPTLRCVPLWSG